MTPTKPPAPHLFEPDPDLGADHHGRQVCATCRLVGRPDDQRHTLPDPPQDDAQSRAAGERTEP